MARIARDGRSPSPSPPEPRELYQLRIACDDGTTARTADPLDKRIVHLCRSWRRRPTRNRPRLGEREPRPARPGQWVGSVRTRPASRGARNGASRCSTRRCGSSPRSARTVTHWQVAKVAGLPLASTTHWFDSKDALELAQRGVGPPSDDCAGHAHTQRDARIAHKTNSGSRCPAGGGGRMAIHRGSGRHPVGARAGPRAWFRCPDASFPVARSEARRRQR